MGKVRGQAVKACPLLLVYAALVVLRLVVLLLMS